MNSVTLVKRNTQKRLMERGYKVRVTKRLLIHKIHFVSPSSFKLEFRVEVGIIIDCTHFVTFCTVLPEFFTQPSLELSALIKFRGPVDIM